MSGPVIDNGLLVAANGTTNLYGSLSGTGQIQIGTNGTLDLASVDPASTVGIAFAGQSGVLSLSSASLINGVSPSIAGLKSSDAIDYAGAVDSATYDPTTDLLTLSDQGTTVAQLNIGAGFDKESFIAAPLGNGTTQISLSTGSDTSTAPSGTASADAYVWNAVAGSWDLASNWTDTTTGSTASVAPGSNDAVTIGSSGNVADAVTGTGASASLALSGSVTLQGQFSTGTVSSSGTTTVNGSGLAISGDASFGTLDIGSGATVSDGGTFTAGPVNVDGGTFSQSGTLRYGDFNVVNGSINLNKVLSNGGFTDFELYSGAGGVAAVSSLSMGYGFYQLYANSGSIEIDNLTGISSLENVTSINGGSLKIDINGSSGGQYDVDNSSSIEFGSAGGAKTGAITVDSGATATNASMSGPVIDNGLLVAANGTTNLYGSLSGTGQIQIGTNGTLDLASVDPASTVGIAFAGQSGVLSLSSASLINGVSPSIAGLKSSDAIDYAGAVDSATYDPTTDLLTLSDQGTTVAQLNIGAGFDKESFIAAPLGNGTTQISLSTGSDTSTAPSGTASADAYVWNAVAGSWDLASNWTDTTTGSTASVAPGSNDAVTIGSSGNVADTVTGTGASASLALSGSVTLQGQFSTGTVSSSGTTTVNGSGLAISGDASFGTLDIGSGATVSDGGTFTAGPVNVDGGTFSQSGTLRYGDFNVVNGSINLNKVLSNGGFTDFELYSGAGGVAAVSSLSMGYGFYQLYANSGSIEIDNLTGISSLENVTSINGGSLKIDINGSSGGQYDVDNSSSIEFGSAGGAKTGAITVDSGATATNASMSGPVIDNGLLVAANGTTNLYGSLSGTGQIQIGTNGTLDLESVDPTSAVKIAFAGQSGVLNLSSASLNNGVFTPSITGFGGSDAIDYAGAIDSATYDPTTNLLTLSDQGTTVAQLNIGDGYTGESFIAAPLGNGTTQISLYDAQGDVPPTTVVPGAQTVTQGVAAPVAGVSVTDNTPGITLGVTVTDESGLLTANTTAAGGGGTITGSGTTKLFLSGTVAQIDADLSTLAYQGTAAGSDSIVVSANDGLGGVSNAQIAVTIGKSVTAAPASPTNLSLDAATDSGVKGDGLTNTGQVLIDGTAAANSTVTLYDNTTVVGTGQANGSGAFQIQTSALANGTHNLTATATDGSGLTSAASAAYAVTVDTAASLTIASIDGNGFVDAANASAGITISGTSSGGLGAGDLAGQPIAVTLNGQTYAGTIAKDGTWSVAVGASALAPLTSGQTYTVSASAVDPAGNAASATTTAKVDLGATLAAGSLTIGYNQTQDVTSLITGLVTPGFAGDTETVTSLSAASGTATLSNGDLTYTAPAGGTDTLTYAVKDQLGNVSTGTVKVAVDSFYLKGSPTTVFASIDAALAVATTGQTIVTNLNPLVLTAAQTKALEAQGVDLSGPKTILQDSAANIQALTASQVAGFGFLGVVGVTSTDGSVTLTAAKALAYEEAGLSLTVPTGSTVTVADTAANLQTLTASQIAALHGVGITALTSTTTSIPFNVAQVLALQTAGLSLNVPPGTTVTDTATNIQNGLAGLAAYAGAITTITATGGTVTVSTAGFTADQAALDKIVGGYGVTDTAANVQAALPSLEADAGNVKSIALSDAGTLALSFTQYTAATALLAKIVGSYGLSLSAVPVASLATLEQNSHVTSIGVSDTGAALGGGELGVLGSDAKVKTIAVSDGQPLTLTYAQYGADAAGLAKLGTTYSLTVTGVAAANLATLEKNTHVASIGVSDTAAHLSGTALATLGADPKIVSIAVSDANPITLTSAQYTADAAGLAKLTGTYSLGVSGASVASVATLEQNAKVLSIGVSDTGANLGGASLGLLGQDPKVTSIAVSDGKPIGLSSAQYAADASALAKITGAYSLSVSGAAVANLATLEQNSHVTSIGVSDTAATLGGAELGTLGTDAKVTSIAVSDGKPIVVTFAQYGADTAALAKLGTSTLKVTGVAVASLATLEKSTSVTSIGVSDTAANLGGAELGVLGSDPKVGSVTVSDGKPITLTSAQYAADAAGLAKLQGTYSVTVSGISVAGLAAAEQNASVTSFTVSDTGANLSGAALTALGSDPKVTSIAVSDGQPIALSSAQYAADGASFAKIAGTYSLSVSGVAAANLGTLEQNSHVASIAVSDTGLNLGGTALAALGSDSKVKTITVSDGQPITLTYGQYTADTAGLAKVAGNYALSVSGVSAASLATLEKNTHVASIGVSDTGATLSGAELATLGADAKVTSIAVSDNKPIVLTAAQYAADAAGLAKLRGTYGLSVTGASLASVAGLEQNSSITSIGVSDTGATLSGAALTALGSDPKVTSIAVSDGQPIALSSAQYAADGASFAKIAGTYSLSVSGVAAANLGTLEQNSHVASISVSDTGLNLGGTALAALGSDSKVKSIAVSDGQPITLTYGQYTADTAGLAKVAGSYALGVTGAAVSSLATLEKNAHVASIGVSDTGATLSGAELATLGSDAKVTSIAVSDNKPISLTGAQYTADSAGLAKLAGSYGVTLTGVAASSVATVEQNAHVTSFGVTDTAANIGSVFDTLESHASQVQSISFSDSTTPTLTLSQAQATADANLLSKITTPFVLDVNNTNGSSTIIGSGNNLTINPGQSPSTITGNGSGDTFVFNAGFGTTSITDFYQHMSGTTHDTISLPSAEFQNFASVLSDTTYSGNNAIITVGHDQITLVNVTKAMLAAAASDFKFHA